MSADTWYMPSCPAWCEGVHPCVLTGPDDPTPDAADWAASIIAHGRALVDAPDGLRVDLVREELHPSIVDDPDATPRLFVYLPDHHEAEGATAAELRAWSQVLADAADAAVHLAGGQA